MESLSHCFWDISQRVTAYPLAGCFESQAAIYDRASWDLLWQTNVAIIYIFRIKLRKKKPYWQQPLWPGRQRQEDPQQGGLNFKQAVEPLFNFFLFFFYHVSLHAETVLMWYPRGWIAPCPPSLTWLPAHISSSTQLLLWHPTASVCVHACFFRLCPTYSNLLCQPEIWTFEAVKLRIGSKKMINTVYSDISPSLCVFSAAFSVNMMWPFRWSMRWPY